MQDGGYDAGRIVAMLEPGSWLVKLLAAKVGRVKNSEVFHMSASSSRNLRLIASCAISALLITACSGQPSRGTAPAQGGQTVDVVRDPLTAPSHSGKSSPGEQAAVIAVRQVGVPYRYGGNSVAGFDCSGLVQYAYASSGKKLPRTTSALWQQTQPVAGHQLEVGDVLFFNIEGKVSHVGLYLGSGRFVHAPASGREVTIAELDSAYYRTAFIRGGRPH